MPSFNLYDKENINKRSYLDILDDDLKPYFKAAVGNFRVTEDAKKEFSKLKLDIKEISNLMNTHHNYLKNELKITTPEIDKMIDVSKENGAIGSKIVGSGGGGSVVCLSPDADTSNKIVSELRREGVKDAFIAKEDGEEDMLDMAFEPKNNSRLSCQLIVSDELDGLEVNIPSKQA